MSAVIARKILACACGIVLAACGNGGRGQGDVFTSTSALSADAGGGHDDTINGGTTGGTGTTTPGDPPPTTPNATDTGPDVVKLAQDCAGAPDPTPYLPANFGATLLDSNAAVQGSTLLSPVTKLAIQTFFAAQHDYLAKDFTAAKAKLDALWTQYPIVDEGWGWAGTPVGLDAGFPSAYYALIMLSDATDWRVSVAGKTLPPTRDYVVSIQMSKTALWTVPASLAELDAGKGAVKTVPINRALLDDNCRMLRDSMWLMGEYWHAMTNGRLTMKIKPIVIPRIEQFSFVHQDSRAVITAGAAIPDATTDAAGLADLLQRATDDADAVIQLYPAGVPAEDHKADATNVDVAPVVSGPAEWGLTLAGGGGGGLLDYKPPKDGADMGHGLFQATSDAFWSMPFDTARLRANKLRSRAESMMYLPQWLQHEAFHGIFTLYGEQYHLESPVPHSWYEAKYWPTGFVLGSEPQYYREAMRKKILTGPNADKVLADKLSAHQPRANEIAGVTLGSLLGKYIRSDIPADQVTDWHKGVLEVPPPPSTAPMRWRNLAGGTIDLYPSLSGTGPSAVLQSARIPTSLGPGGAARIMMQRKDDGSYAPKPIGLMLDYPFAPTP